MSDRYELRDYGIWDSQNCKYLDPNKVVEILNKIDNISHDLYSLSRGF